MDLHDARLIWEVLSRHLKAKSRLIRGEVNLLRKCNAIKLTAQLLPWLEAGQDYERCGGDRGDHACQRDEAARNPLRVRPILRPIVAGGPFVGPAKPVTR